MVLDFAPGATSKLDKILVLGQLGLVGEWRKKLDGDFFFIWLGTKLGEASRWSKTT